MRKKALTIVMAMMLAGAFAACGASTEGTTGSTGSSAATTKDSTTADTEKTAKSSGDTEVEIGDVQTEKLSSTAGSLIDGTSLFSERDMTQTADTSEAKYITLSDGQNVSITEKGVYVISGSATEATILVEADDSAKVQIVLDGVTMTNSNAPCIYVKSADKVFITTAEGSTNTLSVTGTFTADGDTNTDGVIFSKDDLTLNGQGTLTIASSDNGVVSKDDLKITGGSYIVNCSGTAFEAHDSVVVADGTIDIQSCNDGLHAEDDDDDTTGYVFIGGGTITIKAADDGIHATTYAQIDNGTLNITAGEGIEATQIQINGGTIDISASDDGINAANKSKSIGTPYVEFNGGETTIVMGQGDTDGVDSNGNITVNGGTISVSGQSTFDCDGTATYNGGTIIENGKETNTMTNQFMGGPGGGRGGFGGNGGMMTSPEGFDKDNLPEDFDPDNLPEGFDKGDMPGNFDPNNLPEGFDKGNMPGNFDPNNLPEGFEGGMGGRGGRGGRGGFTTETTEE